MSEVRSEMRSEVFSSYPTAAAGFMVFFVTAADASEDEYSDAAGRISRRAMSSIVFASMLSTLQ